MVKILGLLRGGLLVAMLINAAGGILTSTHYALVFRISKVVAVIAMIVALAIVIGRAVIVRARPKGFGTVLWAGCAAGAVTTGALTRPAMTWLLVAIWAVFTVAVFIADRTSSAPAGSVH
ncbi:MAG TPA: hypothetical protein VGL36_35425 [Kribbella sp.]